MPVIPTGQIESLLNQQRSKNSGCSHPCAPTDCSGKVIESHTLQRSGSLKAIAKQGHVYKYLFSGDENPILKVSLVGIKKASTFPGFCSKHDCDTFSPIENKIFSADEEQCFLLAYRSIVYELHCKCTASYPHEILDLASQGKSYAMQQEVYKWFIAWQQGTANAQNELMEEKLAADESLLKQSYQDYSHLVIMLDRPPPIVCSGVFNPEYDLRGRKLIDLADLNTPADRVAFNLISLDNAGAAILSWCKSRCRVTDGFIETIEDQRQSDLADLILVCAFDWLENLYLNPEWWDKLPETTQRYLNNRMILNLPFSPSAIPDTSATCLAPFNVKSVARVG